MRSTCLPLAALACTLALPTVTRASQETVAEAEQRSQTTERKRERVRALEIQALGMTQLLPRPGGGGEIAFVFGHPNFQVRVGTMLVGVPAFRLGESSVGNALAAGSLDLCAAKQVINHQIRMCVGGQAGGMAHHWKEGPPGSPATPWGAGTMRGDYQLMLTKRFGIIGGVGIVLPVLGPSFRGRDAYGGHTPVVFPGPMAGFLSLGTTFRW